VYSTKIALDSDEVFKNTNEPYGRAILNDHERAY